MDTRSPGRLLRLLGPYVALGLLLAVLVVVFAGRQIREHREAELAQGRSEVANRARVLEAQASRIFEGFDRALALLAVAHSKGVGDLILAPLADSLAATTEARVERVFNRFDHEGWLAASSDHDARPRSISVADRPYFATARDVAGDRLVVGAPVSGRVSGRPLLPLVRRLERADGGFDGIIAVGIDLATMARLLRAVQGDAATLVGFADTSGRVLVWSDTLVSAAEEPARDASTAGAAPILRIADVVPADAIVVGEAVAGTPLVAYAAISTANVLARHRSFRATVIGYAALVVSLLGAAIALLATRSYLAAGHARALSFQYAVARARARSDPLTGLANREAFDEALTAACGAARDAGTPFVLAFIDLDHFKRLNDREGHGAGDRALRRIADTIVGCVRRSDLPARLGGDEFAILLPGADADACVRLFGAMRDALRLMIQQEGWPIGFSAGVVAFASAPKRVRDAVRIADELMYEAKAGGRDTTRFARWRDGVLQPIEPP